MMIQKEILEDLKFLADKRNMKLQDMLFGHNNDIVFLTDTANLRKNIVSKIQVKGQLINGELHSEIIVPDDYVSDIPLHLCFYLKDKDSKQNIKSVLRAGKNSHIKMFAYCFSVDSMGQHLDNKSFFLDSGSKVELYELHYNTENTYLNTVAVADIKVGENAHFLNEFIGTHGNSGNIRKLITVDIQGKGGSAELVSRMDLKENDKLFSYNKILLNGVESKGLIKSNTVTRKNSDNYFKGIIEGFGDNSVGHIGCDEILLGDGKIQSLPELKVWNSTSKITHESAIGRIDPKSIENLLAKGLSQDQAIDFIVKGKLRN